MSWSHGHEWLLSSDDRGFVKYWQSNMNNVHTFQAHSDPVRCHRWGEDDAQQQLKQHRRCSHCGVVILYSSVSLCCYIILHCISSCTLINDHLIEFNVLGVLLVLI